MYPRPFAQRSIFHIVLALTICAALLPTSGITLLVSSFAQGQAQGNERRGKPRPDKPEGELPDLDEIQNESQLEREPQPPIHSNARSPKNEGQPWDGRRVGDPDHPREPEGNRPDRAGAASNTRARQLTRRAHASRRTNAPPPVPDDQFVQNFFTWALARNPTSAETTYWYDQLRVAYGQGQGSLKLAAIEFGRTLFESAEYSARNRNAHWYVYDLYKTYLMREPDSGGWSMWEGLVPTHGREYVRRGFEESTEFATLLTTITLAGAPSSAPVSLITARVDPRNQPGNGLLARDANWSVPLLSLPGRAKLDLGLTLSYSSQVWTKSGPYIYFDEDNGFPSPGFRLGFPTVQKKVFDAQTARNAFLLITGRRRVELRQVGTSNIYDAADSSYLRLTDNGSTLLIHSTDGARMSFTESNGEFRCVEIKDRNGNYITINYNTLGRITTITDTLARVITFNYDANANLISITQAWNGQPSHQWVSFGWSTRTMQSSFSNVKVVGTANGAVLPVITQINLNDTSHLTVDYTNSLQASVTRNFFGATERNATSFTYETPASDVPRLLSSSVSARNWTGVNGVPAQVTTQYSVAGDGACVLTAPDGTIYKEYYSTGWQKGLSILSEVWSGGVKQKWTTTAWTQDNTGVSYETNPRVTETNVYDASGNRRRVTIDYGSYWQYGLPYGIREYAANGTTEIRQTFIDYNLSQAYLDRRIIGLVLQVHVSNVAQWQSKVTYSYDDPARLHGVPAAATRHDVNYNLSFTARGNVTAVSRWDVTDIDNATKKLTTYTNYYNTGTPIRTTDPAGHQSNVTYADAFSDSVNRNTFAYPTTLTDADGFNSYVQYNFDFGATTRTQSPAPAGQSQGAIQTMTYNNLGQLERTTTTNNGAYKRFWYGTDYVASYATVNNVADESYSIEVVDGLGRVIGAAANHPGSTGGYRLVNTIYDQMGRAWKTSNPFEANSSWIPTGDDAAGIYYTQQTYDWRGRPLVTTNPDLTTREASYGGCGCAGGQVVTLTDEGTIDGGVAKRRQQKNYSDVLGRTVKTEILNWQNGTVYSATVNTYNARDQVTQVRQYAGPEGSATYQDTTMTYDGYGRLKTRHVPEQNVGTVTTYDYFADDTTQKVTDARGASATYAYNSRQQVTSITYSAPSGTTPTPNVSFAYDAAGNRTSMNDGLGSAAYNYNQLSRMSSETRNFTGFGNFTINYQFNLTGQLSSITNPFNNTIIYTRDTAGRLSSVTGTTFGTYLPISTYASNIKYRAWGAIRQLTYGDNKTLSASYNSRMLAATFNVSGLISKSYDYYADGKLRFSSDLLDHRFDRFYSYDHVRRLKQAFSGAEARGEPATTNRPYKQTYGYDAFSHLTARTNEIWWTSINSISDTYVNNRHVPQGTQWQYDADGRLLNGASGINTYDAAGQTIHLEMPSYQTSNAMFGLDGDGRQVKTDEITWNEELETEVTETKYYLRSSVLGGQVLTEIFGTNAGRTFVYAGQAVMAWQWLSYGWEVVDWERADPSRASVRVGGTQQELDPLGGDAGISAQTQIPDEGALISTGQFLQRCEPKYDLLGRRHSCFFGRFYAPG